jgi:penicillin-binding protein 1C
MKDRLPLTRGWPLIRCLAPFLEKCQAPKWGGVLGCLGIVLIVGLWVRLGPLPAGLLDDERTRSTLVVDRHGRPLYEARSGAGTRSSRLTPDTVPQLLADATVAAEDRRFWSHPGVDPLAVLRAIKRNTIERRVVEGGSTITQQVAKLLLARKDPKRSRGVGGKLEEAIVALRLEHRFSKREILAMYLNLAAYGNQIAGASRASRAYFGRDAAMLTAAQAAFLAGLPQRPTSFNPYRRTDLALSRQRVVLRRMEQAGFLTATRAGEARAERLAFSELSTPFLAPHFVEMALAESGANRAEQIETTIDLGLQADVAGAIASHRRLLARHGAANVAVVVLDNARGEWLAWEGSGNYFDSTSGGAINGPVTLRQPGSALKPFTYALAFEEGYSPASVLPDIPSNFPTAEPGVLYSPRNYDGKYRGPLLARVALAGSENVPAVALASELSVPKLLRFLNRAGFTTFDKTAAHYGLGVTLGNAEVRLDEMVAAYAAFARGGEWIEPTWRRALSSSSAQGVAEPRPTARLVSPRTAFWITDVLSDAGAREYIFGRGGSLEFPFPVAVKTGTSQAYHDNWTIGYTRAVTVGVWVGNFDRRPLRNSSGVTGAAPIFHGVMMAAQKRAASVHDGDILAPDATLTTREICALSGLTAGASCPSRRREWTAVEGEPAPCTWHVRTASGVAIAWPPEYREWARGPRGPDHVLQHRDVERHDLTPRGAALRITSPASGATYLIDPTLRREFQTLSLRALAETPGTIAWLVDGKAIGMAQAGGALDWPLTPGTHRFTARDAHGHTADAVIVVR